MVHKMNGVRMLKFLISNDEPIAPLIEVAVYDLCDSLVLSM